MNTYNYRLNFRNAEACNYQTLTIQLIFISLILLFCSCKQKQSYQPLEEKIAHTLMETKIPNTLVSSYSNVVKKPNIVTHCAKQCVTTKIYWAQVLYPVTFCYLEDYVVDIEASIKTNFQALLPFTQSETSRVYVINKEHHPLYLCKIHSGWWHAEIRDIEFCGDCGPGAHKMTLNITSFDDYRFYWEWWGTLEDMPTDAPVIIGDKPWLEATYYNSCDNGVNCN